MVVAEPIWAVIGSKVRRTAILLGMRRSQSIVNVTDFVPLAGRSPACRCGLSLINSVFFIPKGSIDESSAISSTHYRGGEKGPQGSGTKT
eukprot:1861312-Prymnesium_polylepis.3